MNLLIAVAALTVVTILVSAGIWFVVRWTWRQVRPHHQTPATTGNPPAPRKWFIQTHPWWTGAIVIVVWLALAHFATTIGLISWAVMTPIHGVKNAFSEGSPGTIQTAPQGKRIGLLLWSKNANVKPRTRATTETLNASNAAFVGVFPPASYADVTFVAYNENNVPWRAFLVDYTSMRAFPSAQLLDTRATSKAQARDVAMVELQELPQKGRLEKRIYNTSPNSAAGLMECYIELVGGPSSIHLDIKEPSDTFQYEVEVGAEGVSIFEIPVCKYFWIVPVNHQDYQSRFFQYAVPPQGMCIKKATELMEAQRLVQRPDLMGTGYEQTQSFQAVLLTHRGTTSALSEAVGFQGVDVRGATVNLRLNIPTNDDILRQVTKPARVIVGYQL